MKELKTKMLIQDIRPTISDSQQIKLNYLNIKALNIGIKPLKVKRALEAQRIIDLRPNIKDTEFNINDEDLKNGYIGYASWDSKISIPLRS